MTDETIPQPPAPPAAPAFDPRRRLRELLSVPERDRTDEQWDEIVELEIQLAPGNRIQPGTNPHAPQQTSGGGKHGQGGGGKKPQHHRQNKNRRPPKPKPAQGT